MGALADKRFVNLGDVRQRLPDGSVNHKVITDAVYTEIRQFFDYTEPQIFGLYRAAREYARIAITQAIGRTVFATADGRPGLGPQHMKIGDFVTAWADVPVLVVVRPTENGRYIYVGEAYIHGAMDGELTKDGEWSNFRSNRQPTSWDYSDC